MNEHGAPSATEPLAGQAGQAEPWQVTRLAVSALGVLAAEPLYLLVDTATVGHLGKFPLAGLAVGAVVLAQISTQLTFLSYGTTARAARLLGAGRRRDAVIEGVQATHLALLVGVVLLAVGELGAGPLTRLMAGSGQTAHLAESWLRVALLGVPFTLVAMAGNGWMRGVHDTRRPLYYVLAGNGLSALLLPILVFGAGWGIEGSAAANVLAQFIVAVLFIHALIAERMPLRPRAAVIRRQLGLGRDLMLRSLAFQACFLSATVVAARTSAAAVSAHQIVFQLWTFLQLILDSLAIAAQALVGAALGGGDRRRAGRLAWRITRYALALGTITGVVMAALYPVLPGVFTADAQVLGEVPHAWWFFVLLQPVAGVVFALDGVLLGASDVGYLRTTTIAGAVLGFLPAIWAAFVFHWGLIGIWTGLMAFMLIRLVAVLLRARTRRWMVIGLPGVRVVWSPSWTRHRPGPHPTPAFHGNRSRPGGSGRTVIPSTPTVIPSSPTGRRGTGSRRVGCRGWCRLRRALRTNGWPGPHCIAGGGRWSVPCSCSPPESWRSSRSCLSR